MKYDKVQIGDVCQIERKHINPQAGATYTLYSLPAFDNRQVPETIDGAAIKSGKLAVQENMILYNKLNVKYKRVWNIHKLDGANCICSTEFFPLLINNRPRMTQDFLYYQLISKDLTDAMYGARQGTSCSQQRISENSLFSYEISCPPIDVQEKIVGILRALDEKIQLNTEINNNLEQQAQAIYNSWFVDYMPFGGTRPRDWQKTDIYSVANIIYGAPFSSKHFNTESLGKPIIRIRDLKEQVFVTYTTEIHPKGHLIQPGDIVVGMDGEFRPYFWGNTAAWLNQRVCIFENKNANDKAFVYFTIKPLLNIIEKTQVATTVIHIGKKDYDAFEIFLPNRKVLDTFGSITTPMINQIVNNSLENRRLAELRDSLLPRLMSGELDVSNVEL